MKHLTIITLAAFLAAGPAMAQDDAAPGGEVEQEQDEGSWLTEGLRMAIRNALEDLGMEIGNLTEGLRGLAPYFKDMDAFEDPVELPGGDILIRRKPGAVEGIGRPDAGEIDL